MVTVLCMANVCIEVAAVAAMLLVLRRALDALLVTSDAFMFTYVCRRDEVLETQLALLVVVAMTACTCNDGVDTCGAVS